MIKVSVIIPVYNVERYLSECLESVIQQTLNDIEIICVNDGSTDTSLQIIEKYAIKDSRIKVISQNNRGLSAARNAGFREARGTYIYYLDSDDYIELNALEKMYQYASKENLDVLFCDGMIHFDTEDLKKKLEFNTPNFSRKKKYNGVMSGKELFIEMTSNREYQTQVSLCFAKRKFLLNYKLVFQEGLLYEDNLYTLKLILDAEKVAHYPETLFHYRIRANSIMTSKQTSFKNFYSALYIYFEQLKIAEKINEKELRDAVATQVEEVYKRVKITYEVVKTQFLTSNDIYLLENFGNLEKLLMKQLGVEFNYIPLFPYDLVPYKAKIVLYGAGRIGRYYYKELLSSNFCEIIQWVDRQYVQVSMELNTKIVSPKEIVGAECDGIVLAIENESEADDVIKFLLTKGVKREKIIWIKPRYINI